MFSALGYVFNQSAPELSQALHILEEVSESLEGFFSYVFLVHKKAGGTRPILDLRNLNIYVFLNSV